MKRLSEEDVEGCEERAERIKLTTLCIKFDAVGCWDSSKQLHCKRDCWHGRCPNKCRLLHR